MDKINKVFLERCIKVLKAVKNRYFEELLYDNEKEFSYLFSHGLIGKVNGNNYVLLDKGELWLNTFRIEEMIIKLEREEILLETAINSAKSAEKSADAALRSADSTEDANKKSAKANIISIVSAIIAALSLLFSIYFQLK